MPIQGDLDQSGATYSFYGERFFHDMGVATKAYPASAPVLHLQARKKSGPASSGSSLNHSSNRSLRLKG